MTVNPAPPPEPPSRGEIARHLLERGAPAMLAGAAAAAAVFVRELPYGFREMLNAGQQFGIVAAGVVGAALSLLYTVGRNTILDAMKASAKRGGTNYHALMAHYMMSGARSGIVLSLVSIAAFGIRAEPAQGWHRFAFAAWCACVVYTAAALFRALRSLSILITSD